jgi:lysyl-tRNA synthetase class 2
MHLIKNFQTHFIKEWTTQAIRDYFIHSGFHEIETPVLLTQVPMEPNLYPLKTHWREKNQDFYLPISPESSLKKLIAQGVGDCFSIAKVFRDLEDIGPTHNLEFSMLEWYEMNKNYLDIAETTENLVLETYHRILKKLNKSETNILNYQGISIDLTPPWHYFTLKDLFKNMAHMDLTENMTTEKIVATAKSKGYNTDGITTWEPLYTQIFINEIESKLPQDKPVFILDYPTSQSGLCQPCPNQPGFSERFEFYIGGMEIGNAYTELTDPKILENNFKKETEYRKENSLPVHPYDKELVEATQNFPECGGIGLGIDRLAMLFANTTKIEDVVYFPTSTMIYNI